MGMGMATAAQMWEKRADYAWIAKAKQDMERELTVHVVTIVCMRHVAAGIMGALRDWAVSEEPLSLGVGLRILCRFPEVGVDLSVDQGMKVHVASDVVIVLLPDDSLGGGATVTSRWARPEV